MAVAADPRVQLVELLFTNGVQGQGSRAALQQLNAYKADPTFVGLVCDVVSSAQPTFDTAQLSAGAQACDWGLIRDVAAWLLKTCIVPGLTYEVQCAAAQASLGILQEAGATRRLSSAAAVVVARLTSINGVGWWTENNLDLSALLLDQMLRSDSGDQVAAALRCLQYLVEDAASSLGGSITAIVERIAETAVGHSDVRLQGLSVQVLFAIYDFGAELDWKVEVLSDAQQGLVAGAGAAARAAASVLSRASEYGDEPLTQAFRLAEYLLDYLKDIGGQLGEDLAVNVLQAWVQAALAGIGGGAAAEVTTCACSFIAMSYNLFNAAAGEGPINIVTDALNQNLEGIVDQLLVHMTMSVEEEEAMMASDAYDSRDPHIRRRNSSKRRGADEKSSADDDAEVPEQELRDYACIALEAACQNEPTRVTARVVSNIQHVFTANVSWRELECGICALGTIFEQGQNDLIPHMANLVPSIGERVGSGEPSPQHHIATISIALWTLSKFSSYTIMRDEALFDNTVACALPCMTSSSKRVQFAATTFFRNVMRYAVQADPYSAGAMGKHLPSLLEAIKTCAPVFHTKNLAILVEVTLLIVILPCSRSILESLAPFFAQELQNRLPRLQESAQQRYGNDDPRVQLDIDCFHIGSVTAGIYAAVDLTPAVSGQAASEFSTMTEVVKFALQLEAHDDDTSMVHYPMQIMVSLASAITDDDLTGLLQQNGGEFVNLLLHVGTNVDDGDVRSSVCSLLYDLATRFGASVVPNVDAAVAMCMKFGTFADAQQCVADGALLMTKFYELQVATDGVNRYATVLAQQVRGDAHDNSAMSLLTQCVGAFMESVPQLFDLRSATETCLALRRCDNDQYKASASNGVIAVIGGHAASGQSAPNELTAAGQAFVRLTLSWQRDSLKMEGLQNTIGSFFASASQHPVLSQAVGGLLNEQALPREALQMLRTQYGI